MKKCTRCLENKNESDYYFRKESQKFRNQCKDCWKELTKKLRVSNMNVDELKNKERKRGRDKYYRLNYRGKQVLSKQQRYAVEKKWKEKYPEKQLARLAICNKKTITGTCRHHWSYHKEHHFDFILLSVQQHMKLHRHMIYDQERMMYRRADNNLLLDTRESHELFIDEVLKIKE